MGLDDPAPAETGVRRAWLVASGACLLGFLAMAGTGSVLTPWPDDFAVTPKLEYLREHAGEIDALYIGKSHVFRSFIPRLIDARLAKAGIERHSFNMGGPGMCDVETDHLLRTVLEIEGLHLREVYIEVPDWRSLMDDNLDTNRAVNWHTVRQTERVLRGVFLDSPSWVERAERAWPHLELAWVRATAYGQGKRIVASLLGETEPQPLSEQDIARSLGYQGLDDLHTPEMNRRRAAFVRTRDTFEERVTAISTGNAAGYDLSHYDMGALERQIALVRAAGARPIYILPPGMDATPYAYALEKRGSLPDLMAFNDPVRYPDLYRYDRRFDGHLNRQGALEFSRLFADQLSRLLK